MKDDFVANASHELRTPLHSLIGFLTLLREGKVEDRQVQSEFLDRAADDADRLKELVGDLLDLSKLDSGTFTLELEPLSVTDLVQYLVNSLEPLAEEKQITLSIAPPTEDFRILGDRSRLLQVLTNLTENAIKFSQCYHQVLVSAERTEDSGHIAVIDQGPGIPAEYVPSLFNKFYRVPVLSGRKHTGTGLGLHISKRIVEVHGGSIGVESVEGEGSTFWIDVPLVEE
jgi:signal transduction histidine kinase